MLTISGLSINFGSRYLFDNVTFTIGDNDRIGLIGRNGTGKSTLLKILCEEIPAGDGTIIKSNGYTIGYLPQDGNFESELSVFAETRLALEEINRIETELSGINHEIATRSDYNTPEYGKLLDRLNNLNTRYAILEGNKADAKVEIILHGLGFENAEFSRCVNEFSGGWRMRIALAKILLSSPDLLLLDEPTNHLDIESIVWLENFLKGYFGAALIVSHDRRFLDNVTTKTIEIANAKTVMFNVPYSEFVRRREEQRDQQLAAFKSQQKQIEATEKYIERFRYKATLASRVQSKIKMLDKVDRIEVEDEDLSHIRIKFPPSPRSGAIACNIKNLTKYYGEKLILKDVNLLIERGDKIAFVGRNGEGKTTLTRVIVGETDFSGECETGHNISIGYFSQHQADLLDKNLTVFETIDNVATGDMRTKVRSILGAFLFSGDSVDKKVRVLSGGERSRLAMAKLLLEPHNLLILDEPTNHLDMTSKDVLKDALASYDGTLIVVSHDRDFLHDLTGKTYWFHDHKVKEYSGGIDFFLEKQQLEQLSEVERKNTTAAVKPAEASAAKLQREEQKKFDRECNRLKKQISDSEKAIADTESAIRIKEIQFSSPKVMQNPAEIKKLQKEYNDLKTQLDSLMSQWEELGIRLEELTDSNKKQN